jgi:acyl-CoA dehydrogenase
MSVDDPYVGFQVSPRAKEVYQKLHAFMEAHVYPNEGKFHEQVETGGRWQPAPLMEELKARARAEGLWNLFLPESEYGAGLSNLEYAPMAELMGRSVHFAPEVFNCSAPDTGNMEVLVRYGSEGQKERWLRPLLAGEMRSCFAMTEPEVASSDATNIQASIKRDGDEYVVDGRKIYISRVQHSDLMVLLARTTPIEEVKKRSRGLSVFLVDLREAVGNGLTIRQRRVMMNNETNELLFEGLRVPASALVGEEGEGFRYIMDGMNAERILIAAECIGDGRFFVDRATGRANEREVFGRRIGQNQGVQFPIARAHVSVQAADLMTRKAADLFDRGESCGAEANMAKLLAADASWEAANAAVQTLGGYGFDAEYDVERKFRETRLYQVAPISTNLILSYVAEHVLKLPRSF